MRRVLYFAMSMGVILVGATIGSLEVGIGLAICLMLAAVADEIVALQDIVRKQQ
jgi:hypothetical protein